MGGDATYGSEDGKLDEIGHDEEIILCISWCM